MFDVVEIFPELVSHVRAIAHCHDVLDDGFLGNALFTLVSSPACRVVALRTRAVNERQSLFRVYVICMTTRRGYCLESHNYHF